ncbi:hypothetical protein AGOR_G00157980 [Albula goreensis]|uniref:AXH domain-containing protein n=1 Tax=Albula goreensis TaxID=1534307 RepID=A0A8T3CZR5_9TELE|nr:hypothetical protein AGOR_G00157980 [Albula goreensis]
MSSSPGQGKECLPPKKRESRQGSTDQCPADTFKRPAPLWERGGGRRTEQRGEPGEEEQTNPCYATDVPPPITPPMTPPLSSAPPQTPPLPAPSPMYLPWHVPYPANVANPFLSSPSEENTRSSLVWRGACASGADPVDSSWSRSLALRHTVIPIPYRTHFSTDSGDLFTALPPSQRGYGSTHGHNHVTHSQLYSRPLPYSRDALLHDEAASHMKRPNGFARRDSWQVHAGRPLDRQGYGRHGWENQENPYVEGKHGYHDYRQSPTRAVSRNNSDMPPPGQRKDLWVTPKSPPAKVTGARSTAYDPPTTPTLPGRAFYSPPPPTHASSLQRPLQHTQNSPPTAHRNTELSLLVENVDVAVSRQQNQGPNGDHPPKDSQRFSCPSPGGQSSKSRSGNPLHPPGPSSPPLRSPMVLPYFRKGSLIDLGGGRLRRVEELRTEDFLLCPDPSPDIHLSSCTVLLISPSPDPAFSRLQVLLPDHSTQELLEVLLEYPFFVRDRGWSSCCPRKTAQLYELRCHQLRVGDVCLALTPSPAHGHQSSPHPLGPPKSRGKRGGPSLRPKDMHSRTEEGRAIPPSPPPPPHSLPDPTMESLQKRKRHRSAPELTEQGVGTSHSDLPHTSKHRKQQ